MEPDDIDDIDDIAPCIACGDSTGASGALGARPVPALCADCTVAGSGAARRSPSTLGSSDGTYRLGSWWRDGSSPAL